jgi:UDP-N-acetylglucosamine 2-epimerase (non-hydrolysing)
VAATEQILRGDGKRGRTPALWDGHAAERIVEILLRAGLRGRSRVDVT